MLKALTMWKSGEGQPWSALTSGNNVCVKVAGATLIIGGNGVKADLRLRSPVKYCGVMKAAALIRNIEGGCPIARDKIYRGGEDPCKWFVSYHLCILLRLLVLGSSRSLPRSPQVGL